MTTIYTHSYTDDDVTPLLAQYGARPIETAPKHGGPLRLLVDYKAAREAEDNDLTGTASSANPLDDTARYAWTIGHNNFDHDGEDVWLLAGWCWSHDHYTDSAGTPVGWLPFFDGE